MTFSICKLRGHTLFLLSSITVGHKPSFPLHGSPAATVPTTFCVGLSIIPLILSIIESGMEETPGSGIIRWTKSKELALNLCTICIRLAHDASSLDRVLHERVFTLRLFSNSHSKDSQIRNLKHA